MTEKFIVAGTFDTYPEGELLCSRLKEEGIPAVVTGPNGASTFGTYFGAMGRVTVLVPAKFADRLPPPDEPADAPKPPETRRGKNKTA